MSQERPSPDAMGQRVVSLRDAALPERVMVAPAGRQTVLWLIAVLLAVVATALIVRRDDAWLAQPAWAQRSGPNRSPMVGARGIYAFTGQLSSKNYGLFMLDVDTGTLWCYELQQGRENGQLRLRLAAARSWIFDRYLEEFNVAAPTPSEVRTLVRQQRSHIEAADTSDARAPGDTSGGGQGQERPTLPKVPAE